MARKRPLPLELGPFLAHIPLDRGGYYILLGASVLLLLAGSMASSIGVALKKNRDNLLRRNRELSRISKIAKVTSQTLDFDMILDSTCKELTSLFPIRYAAIGLIDDQGGGGWNYDVFFDIEFSRSELRHPRCRGSHLLHVKRFTPWNAIGST